MSDLGLIGTNRGYAYPTPTLPSGYWAGSRARVQELCVITTIPTQFWQGMVVMGWEIRDVLRLNQPPDLIAGTVTLDGDPVSRLVRIHHRNTGMLSAAIVSGSDGSYSLAGFYPGEEYYVVALPALADGANAVVVDRVRVE